MSEYIGSYRAIRGDGNCFYRAIFFYFIETCIEHYAEEKYKKAILDLIELAGCFYEYFEFGITFHDKI